jgi:hypothetical protein
MVQIHFTALKKYITMVLASDCKCYVCKAPAVAFWPVVDPDIPSHPYCRKCLDKAKFSTMIKLQELMNMDNQVEKKKK